MIIGSGLLAKAFEPRFGASDSVWVYAAGVSNSNCTDAGEFERERRRLATALDRSADADAFVYFSTCSIDDPEATSSDYVQHKLAMEALTRSHRYVIVRLPQVCGRTPNPHTLMNFLYARISRGEAFQIWTRATRNVIDVDDVAAIVSELLEISTARSLTVNVANPVSHSVPEIVAAMEEAVGKRAITRMVEEGGSYHIDTSEIQPLIDKLGLSFDEGYVRRVARKYYGSVASA